MSKPIYIINGPNLNLLGTREPEIYGTTTLADIEAGCAEIAASAELGVKFSQSNHEGALVDTIQEAGSKGCALIINPAAYTHTSIALLDAIKTLDIPVIEVHLSQPAARESFRHHSYVAQGARATISGLGEMSYYLAIQAVIDILN